MSKVRRNLQVDFQLNPAFISEFKGKLGKGMNGFVADVAAEVKNLAPVDTGELKASIRHETSPTEVEGKIYSTDGKGGFVEVGRKPESRAGEMKGHHFFRRAVYRTIKRSAKSRFGNIV